MLRPLAVLLLLSYPAAAAEPWEKKPYAEWNEKEAMKVLTNSPWAHAIPLQLKDSEARDGRAFQAGVTADDRFGTSKDTQYAKTNLNLVWSGKVVRMAQLRQRQLRGAAPDAEGDKKFIEGPDPDFYVFVLQAPGFAALGAETPEGLAGKTVLRVGGKKAGREIKCERVEFPGGNKEVAVFFFPRKDAPIAEADGDVEFATTVAEYEITRGFDLADMKHEGALDL